ncbi:MAG TPA: hypothetical protein VK255_03430 [Patescibacteria group bacterium]|nr:hypothetical protein [Patescibacteria group bacterium]
MRKKLILFGIALALVFGTQIDTAKASKSPTPRITEVVGTSYSSGPPQVRSARVHFQFLPVKNNEIIKVRYMLKGKKFTGNKFKPKGANKSGLVNAACSYHGSAVDLINIPDNMRTLDKRFIYDVKVRIKQPGKSWSSWSNYFSF